MVDAKAKEAPSPGSQVANSHTSKSDASQARPAGKASDADSRRASAAKIDEMLAGEALASLKRARAAARTDTVKPKPYAPVPAATIVVKPSPTQAWKAPFVTLAMMVGICTIICSGAIAYLLMRPVAIATTSNAELRNLRETVAQLQRTVSALSNDLAATHTALDSANKTANDRYDHFLQSLERVERGQTTAATHMDHVAAEKPQVARATTVAAPSDITGSVRQQLRGSSARRETTIPGWSVRRAYEGVAVLVGQPGVIEVVLGQDVPDLGRIEDIRYENGRWLVLTSKGIIRSAR